MVEQRYHVSGMTCGHCVRAVTQAIQGLDAAARVTVDLEGGLVVVDSTAAPALVADAIRAEGYTVGSD